MVTQYDGHNITGVPTEGQVKASQCSNARLFESHTCVRVCVHSQNMAAFNTTVIK